MPEPLGYRAARLRHRTGAAGMSAGLARAFWSSVRARAPHSRAGAYAELRDLKGEKDDVLWSEASGRTESTSEGHPAGHAGSAGSI